MVGKAGRGHVRWGGVRRGVVIYGKYPAPDIRRNE